ncbi:MAG: hypothetical protein COW01_05420 [Bdellovibrionales bacterium CG12_big_fil_rev_8_21_14_0_65_38_15]|nr:MAG: hypothetical protein COW79_06280 [Bdellovibrionales bacterium CG22_combo_CG10-13_8_21_14_all_38_13]PIQ56129.1 MAG: hypothetical protein COW01_05420 [Bdellovibrionales bacterium CG12_big_fil_rev_8_21_14_0_65_38_15]PIR28265.1 MAG: hypothetical protein COV38_16700 [Bdellovibrionales bacterium CG11_big_fil_rev_8_21_14_0_20_38_13]
MKFYFAILVAFMAMSSITFASSDLDYRNVGTLSPSDYLLGSHGRGRDPVFDEYRTIDLNLDIGLGADCGRISIENTMKAALKNILDARYLGDMGKDIMAASPMLLTCYFSPTWCSILKHSRIQSNFLAQLRMNQCKAIDSYTDSKVSEFYEQRAECVRKANQKSGGNFEQSMESCKNYLDADIANWSGDGKTAENRLIESTAKWAGFKGASADRVVNLTKAFIGDTIIKRGSLSIDYGPHRVQLTPRTYLMDVRKETFEKLCGGVVKKILDRGGYRSNVYNLITDDDLKGLSGGADHNLIDRQTILSLAYLPHQKRAIACRKLSDALAMNIFADDMGRTVDFASSKLTTNPHLPTKRQDEAIRKTRVLKDQIEMTLALEKQNSEPLNQVLQQINKEGEKYQQIVVEEEMKVDQGSELSKRIDNLFFDCADGIGCYKDFRN